VVSLYDLAEPRTPICCSWNWFRMIEGEGDEEGGDDLAKGIDGLMT
jgi:hypothetical protein